MNVQIAQRLAELRRAKGYSQESLARELGLSRQAVSKWERAESSPDTENLIALARLYGVTLDDLLSVDADIADDIAFENAERADKTAADDAARAADRETAAQAAAAAAQASRAAAQAAEAAARASSQATRVSESAAEAHRRGAWRSFPVRDAHRHPLLCVRILLPCVGDGVAHLPHRADLPLGGEHLGRCRGARPR